MVSAGLGEAPSCRVAVALSGGGGSALGCPRGWGEGPSRARRARADAGSAGHSCPRSLATFRGVCVTTTPPPRSHFWWVTAAGVPSCRPARRRPGS